ncbi:MAG: dynamin family protein [Deltaproteobacteria bacterium]|nr:dynamin family protein [Deltaproteobacteria bacterium]
MGDPRSSQGPTELRQRGLAFLDSLTASRHVVGDLRDETVRARAEFDRLTRERRLRLAVLGETSSGKSTFLNAFLEIDLLSADFEPTTAVNTRLSYGPAFQVEASTGQGEPRRLWPHVRATRDTIRTALHLHGRPDLPLDPQGRLTAAGRQSAQKFIWDVTTEAGGAHSLKEVVIRLPSTHLAAALDIIDTPGINPGLAPADQARHYQVTRAAVEACHLAIFLIDARNPLKATEQKFFSEFAPYLSRIFFVANKMDVLDDEEADDTKSYIRENLAEKFQLSPSTVNLYFVSSLQTGGSSRYRQTLVRLREDVIAFMERSRESMVFERAARSFANQATTLDRISKQQSQESRERLAELNARRIANAQEMKSGVLRRAAEAYLTASAEARPLFSKAADDLVERASSAFALALGEAKKKDDVKAICMHSAEQLCRAQLVAPLEKVVATVLSQCLEVALRAANAEFATMYRESNVPQPGPPDPKELRHVAENLFSGSMTISSTVQSLSQDPELGQVARGVGKASLGVIGMAIGGPVGAIVGGLLGGALGGLFTSITELQTKAFESFSQAANAIALSAVRRTNQLLDGDDASYLNVFREAIDRQIAAYTEGVERLISDHRRNLQETQATIGFLDTASADAARLATWATELSATSRRELEGRTIGGTAGRVPLLDEDVLEIIAGEAFSAACHGGLGVPSRIARWLAGDGALVLAPIDGDQAAAIANADTLVRLLRSEAGDTEQKAWCKSQPAALLRLGLTPTDVAVLAGHLQVEDVATAVIAASRGWLRPGQVFAQLGARGVAVTEETIDRAIDEIGKTCAAWGRSSPDLALVERKLRRACRRRAAWPGVVRAAKWTTALAAGVAAAIILFGVVRHQGSSGRSAEVSAAGRLNPQTTVSAGAAATAAADRPSTAARSASTSDGASAADKPVAPPAKLEDLLDLKRSPSELTLLAADLQARGEDRAAIAKHLTAAGMKRYRKKDLAGAAKVFELAVAADDQCVSAIWNRACVAGQLKDAQGAVAWLDKLRALETDTSRSYVSAVATERSFKAVRSDPVFQKWASTVSASPGNEPKADAGSPGESAEEAGAAGKTSADDDAQDSADGDSTEGSRKARAATPPDAGAQDASSGSTARGASQNGSADARPAPVASTRLSGAAIKRTMSALKQNVQRCSEEHGGQGTIKLKVQVAPSGEVKTVGVHESMAGAPVAACISALVRAAKFPSFEGKDVVFVYPYLLR